MGAKAKIEISELARQATAELASAKGFQTAEDYIEALLLDDLGAVVSQPWLKQKIEEGQASPIVGALTTDRVCELVEVGFSVIRQRMNIPLSSPANRA